QERCPGFWRRHRIADVRRACRRSLDEVGCEHRHQPGPSPRRPLAPNLGAGSYRPEVQRMLLTHPDVILTETIGSAGTYLGEVKQLNNGKMIPFIGTSATIDPVWFKQVVTAIGLPDFLANYTAVDLKLTLSGAGYDEFVTQLTAADAKFSGSQALTYKGKSPTVHLYDGIIMTALAMV